MINRRKNTWPLIGTMVTIALLGCAQPKPAPTPTTAPPAQSYVLTKPTVRTPPPTPPSSTQPRRPATPEETAAMLAKVQASMADFEHFQKRTAQTFELPSTPSQPLPKPSVGFVGRFSTDAAGTLDDMRRYDQLIIAQDNTGMKQMVDAGNVWRFSGEARIIQVVAKTPISGRSHFHYCEIRATDGERAGSTFWVSVVDGKEFQTRSP